MAIKIKYRYEEYINSYCFAFSFSKWEFKAITGVTELIRGNIPSSAREYDARTKEWTVLEPFWGFVSGLFIAAKWEMIEEKVIKPEDFFYENQGKVASATISREDLANQLLEMLGITAEELADTNKAKKAYRRQALMLHPDRNHGDGSKMSELNSIWSAYNAN